MALAQNIIVVNVGSSSKKYALFQGRTQCVLSAYEFLDNQYRVEHISRGKTTILPLALRDFTKSFSAFIHHIQQTGHIQKFSDIDAIAIRIVAAGSYFQRHAEITPDYLQRLEQVSVNSPLHILGTISEIQYIKKILPDITLIGCSDSAFHKTLTDTTHRYALPEKDARRFDIYRFGYHGLSVQSVVETTCEQLHYVPQNMIVCHLGSGTSVTAIKRGKSVNTSMGYTPLEGIPMSSRVGSIDAGAVLALLEKSGMTPNEMNGYFNKRCGLLGLSGISPDIHVLLSLYKRNPRARQAITHYIQAIKQFIGAYTAQLGKLDVILLTGTVAVRNATIRTLLFSQMDHFGIILNPVRNRLIIDRSGFIHSPKSNVKIFILPTGEMTIMAKIAYELLDNQLNISA